MARLTVKLPLFHWPIVRGAVLASFRKLHPKDQWHNPVMFVVWVASILTTALGVQALAGEGEAPAAFIFGVSLWLWFTVLFATGRRRWPRAARKRTPMPSAGTARRCAPEG